MKNLKYLTAIANKLEDVFWDAVGEGASYDDACEAVDDWVGNNYVEGLYDQNEEIIDSVMEFIFRKIPSEEKFLNIMDELDEE